MEYYKARKSYGFGGVLVAGNGNSGNVIAFRLSYEELLSKWNAFREEYGDGSKGIVTFPVFCDYIDTSIEAIRECYWKGKTEKNAYSTRSMLIEKIATAIKGLCARTGKGQQSVVTKEIEKDWLAIPDSGEARSVFLVKFAYSDGRGAEAMK